MNKKTSPKKTVTTKAKKIAKVAKIPFYSTAGRVLNAARDKSLARGTYAHLGHDGAQAIRDLKIRIGTTKGTVYEGSALDFLKGVLADRGIRLDVNSNSLPAIAGVSAAS